MNYLYVYGAALAVILILYLRRSRRLHQSAAQELKESLEAGLAEPASLHPVVNPARCMGSGSCARACPEDALGVVRGKAVLINASACIGHGACLSACPVEAISLVFGTEKRGIDIPNISPEFETNVAGIYIAGELGGMGLIRKAAEQGRQAIEAIRKHKSAYLMAVGGAAYLVAKAIRKSKVVGFADLGMEAIYEFEIADMPVTVAVDAQGISVHNTGPKEWQAKIGKIPVVVA